MAAIKHLDEARILFQPRRRAATLCGLVPKGLPSTMFDAEEPGCLALDDCGLNGYDLAYRMRDDLIMSLGCKQPMNLEQCWV